MRRLVVAMLALLAATVAWPSADEPDSDPAALIVSAIRAHGGETGLGKWANLTYETDATYFFGASEVQGNLKVHVRDGRMVRRDSRATFGGMPFDSNEASTGKSAWARRRSRVYDYPVDDFNTWLKHRPDILLRARAADPLRLTLVGSGDLNGEPVVMLDFEEHEGSTRILLDADSHLVRGLEYQAVENRGAGRKEERFFKKTYADYRPVDGVPFPHAMEQYREGARQAMLTVTSVELGKMPEVAMFAKPQADEEAKQWSDQIAN